MSAAKLDHTIQCATELQSTRATFVLQLTVQTCMKIKNANHSRKQITDYNKYNITESQRQVVRGLSNGLLLAERKQPPEQDLG